MDTQRAIEWLEVMMEEAKFKFSVYPQTKVYEDDIRALHTAILALKHCHNSIILTQDEAFAVMKRVVERTDEKDVKDILDTVEIIEPIYDQLIDKKYEEDK